MLSSPLCPYKTVCFIYNNKLYIGICLLTMKTMSVLALVQCLEDWVRFTYDGNKIIEKGSISCNSTPSDTDSDFLLSAKW